LEILIRYILIVSFTYFLAACQPSGQSVNSQKNVNLVSSWSGYYQPTSPLGSEGNIYFKLYDDNTLNLTATKNNYNLSASGSYTLNGTNFKFEGTGTASTSSDTSAFQITLYDGVLSPGAGIGKYSINYTKANWGEESGNWNVHN
jgi:hypothetical protein